MSQNENRMYITFPAIPENERMARMIAASFITNMNPTIEELDDVKTAVSEAVTNCVIHAYRDEQHGTQKQNMAEISGKQNDDISEQKEAGNQIEMISEQKEAGNQIEMILEQKDQIVTVVILDKGKGIENIALAMEPLYTSIPEEERSGMGFSFMEAFMNELYVESEPGKGTKVTMKKQIGK